MLSFEFDLEPGERAIRGMNKIFGDLTDFFSKVAVPALKNRFRLIFDREGAVTPFSRWEPLSARYARQKARLYPGALINERTGRYKRSLTQHPYLIIRRHRLVYGSRIRHGVFIELGGRNRPPRGVFERIIHPQQAPALIQRLFNRYVFKKMQELLR